MANSFAASDFVVQVIFCETPGTVKSKMIVHRDNPINFLIMKFLVLLIIIAKQEKAEKIICYPNVA